MSIVLNTSFSCITFRHAIVYVKQVLTNLTALRRRSVTSHVPPFHQFTLTKLTTLHVQSENSLSIASAEQWGVICRPLDKTKLTVAWICSWLGDTYSKWKTHLLCSTAAVDRSVQVVLFDFHIVPPCEKHTPNLVLFFSLQGYQVLFLTQSSLLLSSLSLTLSPVSL